ncbi:MAG: MarR family winged helix-turn-helix transcriptional regulator [Clostridia bacterium]
MESKNTITHAQVEELEFLLRKISAIIKRRGRDILTDFKITPPQFNALLVLRKNGDMTIGELGEAMYLACSTATDLIDRMERNGLVERARDTNDRRVIRIHVLDKGEEVLEHVMIARKNYLQEVLEHVDNNQCQKMIESMSLLYDKMTKEELA